MPWRARLDLDDLNAACCESLADKLRSDLRLLEELGVADRPEMSYVAWAREYLRLYAADAGGSVSADPQHPSAARHLRSVS